VAPSADFSYRRTNPEVDQYSRVYTAAIRLACEIAAANVLAPHRRR
jgi:hypothetical protein